jgi:hypothetical protein
MWAKKLNFLLFSKNFKRGATFLAGEKNFFGTYALSPPLGGIVHKYHFSQKNFSEHFCSVAKKLFLTRQKCIPSLNNIAAHPVKNTCCPPCKIFLPSSIIIWPIRYPYNPIIGQSSFDNVIFEPFIQNFSYRSEHYFLKGFSVVDSDVFH